MKGTHSIRVKKRKIKWKDWYSLRGLGDIIKQTSICISGVSEGEEWEKGTENLFAEIMVEISLT